MTLWVIEQRTRESSTKPWSEWAPATREWIYRSPDATQAFQKQMELTANRRRPIRVQYRVQPYDRRES